MGPSPGSVEAQRWRYRRGGGVAFSLPNGPIRSVLKGTLLPTFRCRMSPYSTPVEGVIVRAGMGARVRSIAWNCGHNHHQDVPPHSPAASVLAREAAVRCAESALRVFREAS